jgi:hypothetical protein
MEFDGYAIGVVAPNLPALIGTEFGCLMIDLVFMQMVTDSLNVVHL